MLSQNPFLKAKEFSKLVSNPLNLSVFLSVAKHKIRKYSELIEEFDEGVKNVSSSIEFLEKTNFIERNPSFLSQKFKLSFSGQLFGEHLKQEFPLVNKFLGERILIEPLKL